MLKKEWKQVWTTRSAPKMSVSLSYVGKMNALCQQIQNISTLNRNKTPRVDYEAE